MPLIDSSGLFNGRRLRKCSNGARLRWPYYFCASNGYGRLKLDPYEVTSTVFAGFSPPISEDQFIEDMREYKTNFLLFVYPSGDEVWGQWSCPEHLLPRYKNADDKASPTPPDGEIKAWVHEYKSHFRAPAHGLLDSAENSGEKRGKRKVSGENANLDENFRDPAILDVEKPKNAKSFVGEERRGVERSGEERKESAIQIDRRPHTPSSVDRDPDEVFAETFGRAPIKAKPPEKWRANTERYIDEYPGEVNDKAARQFISIIQTPEQEALFFEILALKKETPNWKRGMITGAYNYLYNGDWKVRPKAAVKTEEEPPWKREIRELQEKERAEEDEEENQKVAGK